MQRRLTFRNYNHLYKRTCGLCDRSIISNYSPDSPHRIYCNRCWWSDRWDPLSYGTVFDSSKAFLSQWHELDRQVPTIALMNDDGIGSINCEYTYDFAEGKNCHLVFSCWRVEDSAYCYHTNYVKRTFDSLSTHRSEFMHETVRCDRCAYCTSAYFSENSLDCHFCYDVRGCTHCFLSAGLRNKQYYVLNVQRTKEEYERIVNEYQLDTYTGRERAKRELQELLAKVIRRSSRNIQCVDATGDDLRNCKNVRAGFSYNDVVDSKYLAFGDTAEHSYDIFMSGKLRWCYESVTPDRSYLERFGVLSWNSRNLYYSTYCHNSTDLFGCVGLRNQQYCILNKQYTKEEYEKLVPNIIEHMNALPYTDAKGRAYRYGEFFPTELSPFAYNETIAQEYFPLTKDEVLAKGFRWREPEARHYQITLKAGDLPDHIKDVNDLILGEVIGCGHEGKCNEQCTTAFKIIPDELQFYRKMNLALPRLCPNCRHYERLKQRNPLKLWHRKCTCAGGKSENVAYANTATHFHGDAHCPNEFETSYAPERKEIIYCEQCYQAEIV